MDKNNQVTLSVSNDKISINIPGMNKLAFVDYTPEMYNIIKNARFKIPQSEKTKSNYKYPYSNEYKKKLHQIAFDYYFGEERRAEAYKKEYIIEHLDNNGFNCAISNLFLLKKIKNTYKGWHLDKVIASSKQIAALRIYHILVNKTFQITIGFNVNYQNNKTGKILESVRLLYSYDYEIVLQDAEQIIEKISNKEVIDFEEWKRNYRFKDIRINYAPKLQLSEEESKRPPGSYIIRDGKVVVLLGEKDTSAAFTDSISYNKNWNIE